MFKYLSTKITLLALLSAVTLSAQIKQFSLSGTYAPFINTINATEINNSAVGVSLEYEYKSLKHVSFGIEVDWQKYDSEEVYLKSNQPSNLLMLYYTIERNQFNLRPIFRYYWKEDLKGFYVGAFGVYSTLIALPKESPDVSSYPTKTSKSAYKSAAGLGLTYGYRFNLTPRFKVSAFGNHQIVLSDLYDDDGAHQDHQFGLGFSWMF